jgi:hypothetical protein
MEAVRKDDQNDWDPSIKSEKPKFSAEDKVAARLANEILKDNAKLRGVHSNHSIKKILEKEAKRQLMMGAGAGEYKGPVVSIVKDKER